MATKVLWVSYNPLTNEQRIKLERLCGAKGEISIRTLECTEVDCWEDLCLLGEDCDVLAIDSIKAECLPIPLDELTHDYAKTIIIHSKANWLKISVENF